MEKRNLAILGSTGSIGTSTLELVSRHPDRFHVVGLAGGDKIDVLAEQVRKFRPLRVATRTEKGLGELRSGLNDLTGIEFLHGTPGAEAVASMPEARIVVSAIVGAAGLKPTLAAARAGKTIALANKETMVVAGALVSQIVREHKAALLPVDSEHSAIFQSLAGSPSGHVRRILLTASGGPFFKKPETDLSKVTPEEALKHPNWKMGPKVTIDSATMMNKGLEIIEARWLFDLPAEKIDVLIHPQSVVHSMVEYIDGSVLAQLGVPDMKGPIAYALAYPDRLADVMTFLNFSSLRELQFFDPDHERFPSIRTAREALERGETYPAVLNGANEVTVAAFLDRKIGFLDISRINRRVLSSYRQRACGALEDFLEADGWGRTEANKLL
ncbi:MAG: 1-deoxy-D-xylulose-5-phosphate reductoisomerase [Pseudomonadota bacterium]